MSDPASNLFCLKNTIYAAVHLAPLLRPNVCFFPKESCVTSNSIVMGEIANVQGVRFIPSSPLPRPNGPKYTNGRPHLPDAIYCFLQCCCRSNSFHKEKLKEGEPPPLGISQHRPKRGNRQKTAVLIGKEKRRKVEKANWRSGSYIYNLCHKAHHRG